jgi:hypothetical protein
MALYAIHKISHTPSLFFRPSVFLGFLARLAEKLFFQSVGNACNTVLDPGHIEID